MSKTIHQEIRDYIRENPHLNDEILAEKYGVSKQSISANRAHITMGTDTDNPQARAKAVRRNFKPILTLIKTQGYELTVDEDGQYSRLDLVNRKRTKITDDQAKAVMISRLKESQY